MNTNIQTQIQDLLDLTVGGITTINQVSFVNENTQWRVSMDLENKQVFLENNSELLRSIQYIIRVAVHKVFPDDRTHFFLDIANFKKNREQTLSLQIPSLVQKTVLKEGHSVILTNLSGYERLLVHEMISDIKGLSSMSVGNNKNRKLVLFPSSEVGAYNLDDAIIFDINVVCSENYEVKV